ncbi:MAG: hypothetical protein KDK63_02105 [Chlamydiia bacterium]|nr:hypothetical protein [Chlamydiia bacterium]
MQKINQFFDLTPMVKMSKVVRPDFKREPHAELKDALLKEKRSFVLITCSRPSKEGKMSVEMDYDGDHDLLAYLLKSAENYFV